MKVPERSGMKKKFKIEVDCADCAAKMEDAIRRIDGVREVSINFITQKIMVDAEDEKFDEIMKQAVQCCQKVEPDGTIYLA